MLLAMAQGLPQPGEILFKVRVLPVTAIATEPTVPADNVVNTAEFPVAAVKDLPPVPPPAQPAPAIAPAK